MQTTTPQTEGQKVTVEVQTQAALANATSMDTYLAESAEQCPLNSCLGCTWRFCASFSLICWVIYGVIFAAFSFNSYFDIVNDGTNFDVCPEEWAFTGPCCTFPDGASPGTCSTLQTAAILGAVNNILTAIAGTVGLIGVVRLAASLLLVPMAFSVISLLLEIVAMELTWYSPIWLLIFTCISIGVFVPVYKKWRLIKTFNPMFVAKRNTETGMDAYLAQSAKQCPMSSIVIDPWSKNSTCTFCTCRCFGFCTLICWVIFGVVGAVLSFAAYSDGLFDGVTEYCCKDNSYYCGDCCVVEYPVYEASVVEAVAGSCASLQTALVLNGLSNILAVIGGALGLLGMVQMVAALLLAPITYSVISLLLDFVVVALLLDLWTGRWIYLISPVLGLSISILILLPFYKNWRLLHTFKPMGV